MSARRWTVAAAVAVLLAAVSATGASAATIRHCPDYPYAYGPSGVMVKGITCSGAKPIIRHVYFRCAHRCTVQHFACALHVKSTGTHARCANATAAQVIAFSEAGLTKPPAPHGGAGGPSPGSGRIGCRPSGAKTVAQNSFARIFTLTRPAPDVAGATYDKLYGCVFSVGVARGLAHSDFPDEDGHGVIHLAGTFAGYAAYLSGAASGSPPTVYSQDLRSGRYLYTWSAPTDTARVFTDLVVSPTGSLAWIDSDYLTPPSVEVRKSDPSGNGAPLDASTQIDGASLTLTGSTLHWQKAGVAQAATLG